MSVSVVHLFSSWNGLTRDNESEKKLVSLKKVAATLAVDVFLLLLVFGLFALGGIVAVKITGRNYNPDRNSCKCSCFDRYTKGAYYSENQVQYKYIYLNFEFNTLILFAWTAAYAMMLFALVRRVFELVTSGHHLNRAVLLAAVISYYQMFYNWWGTWNYFNDDFYNLFPTQMFFNITENLPAFVLYYLLDKRAAIHLYAILAAQTVSFSHLFIALRDQGFVHFFLSGTATFLVARDVMFFVGDLAPFILFFFYTGRPSQKVLSAQFVGFSILWIIYEIIRGIYGYNQ